MRLIFFLVSSILINTAALLLTDQLLPGFKVSPELYDLFMAAFILTALNAVVRPILKLIMSPLIILTLGLGLIIVNALILYFLTIFVPGITIDSTITLLYATLIIGAVNAVLGFIARRISH